MLQNFPALSWAVTSAILLVYVGAQRLYLDDPSGLLYLGLSPALGAVVFAIRHRLQRLARRPDAGVGEEDADRAAEPAAESVAESASRPSGEIVRYAQRRKLILLVFLLITTPILSAINEAWAETERQSYALFLIDTVAFAICATMWCYFDCAQLGLRIRSGYRFLVFLMPAIGFPIYALKTRGRRGLPLILSGALFLALNYMLDESASIITWYFLPAEE